MKMLIFEHLLFRIDLEEKYVVGASSVVQKDVLQSWLFLLPGSVGQKFIIVLIIIVDVETHATYVQLWVATRLEEAQGWRWAHQAGGGRTTSGHKVHHSPYWDCTDGY